MKNTFDAKWNRSNRCLIINSVEIQKFNDLWRVHSNPEVDFAKLEDAMEFVCILDGLSIKQIEALANSPIDERTFIATGSF